MRRTTLTLSLVAGICTPVFAQNETATLRDTLQQIPASVLSRADPVQISFVDVDVLSAAMTDGLSADWMRRLVFAQPILPLGALGAGVDNFSEAAKVPFSTIKFFAGTGQAPERVAWWGFDDAAAVTKLTAALKADGFSPAPSAGEGVLANGEPGQIDLTHAAAGNPWRGNMGFASLISPGDKAIVQSQSPEALAGAIAPGPAAAENRALVAALDGLDQANAGPIVQAAVVSPLFGLPQIDAGRILPADPSDVAAAQKNFAAEIAAASEGLPLYLTGIVADVTAGSSAKLVVSLAYPDCATADSAIAALKTRSAALQTDPHQSLSGLSVKSESLCAAVITITSGKSEIPANVLLQQLMDAHIQRMPTLLQIGLPE
jgi:hypothetical protein